MARRLTMKRPGGEKTDKEGLGSENKRETSNKGRNGELVPMDFREN